MSVDSLIMERLSTAGFKSQEPNPDAIYYGCVQFPKKHCSGEKCTVALFVYLWEILSYHDLTRLKRFVSQRTSKLCNQFFYLPIFSTPCMGHLVYLMFRCDGDVMESLESLEILWELNTAYSRFKVTMVFCTCAPLLCTRSQSDSFEVTDMSLFFWLHHFRYPSCSKGHPNGFPLGGFMQHFKLYG